MTVSVCIPIAFTSSYEISIVNIVFLPILSIVGFIIYKVTKIVEKNENEYNNVLGVLMSETSLLIKQIKAYNLIKIFINEMEAVINYSNFKYTFFNIIKSFFYGVTQMLIFILYGFIFLVAGNILKRDLTDISIFFPDSGFDSKEYILKITSCIFTILFTCLGIGVVQNFVGDSSSAKEALLRITATIEKKTKIDNMQLGIVPTEIKGTIEFINVSFAYPSKPREFVIKNLNLLIKPGQKIGIVGLSGSGKTSLLGLIFRLYDPQEGIITIDGVDIKMFNLNELRKHIGVIFQDINVFKDSILENVKYGNIEIDKNKLNDAIQKCNLKSMIDKLDRSKYNKPKSTSDVYMENIDFDKYIKNYINEENSNILSGGEKQKLALCRVFLKNPSILLFDEITSSLDKENEDFLNEFIEKYFEGRTQIIVAHKLNNLNKCSQILVLKKGCLIESGSHDELLMRKGLYYKLHKV